MKIKLTESQFNHILKEMRFDGKSTGLFAEEEINEYYSDPYLTTDPENKWDRLEKDVGSCIRILLKLTKITLGMIHMV